MKAKRTERGTALISSLMVVGVVGALSATFFMDRSVKSGNLRRNRMDLDLTYLTEAGTATALAELRSGVDSGLDGLGTVTGTLNGGAYSVTATDLGGGQMRLVSTGTLNTFQQQQETIVSGSTGGIFWNAVFAGNSQADPNYNMPFGGTGTQGDQIVGDVYSGNNLSITGSASIAGAVTVAGTATGLTATKGTQAIPDLAAMGYEVNHDVNVAQVFASKGTYQSDEAGGSAYQVPQNELAHIFRMNPSDRSSETSSTVKDDYFLEDPYEPVQSDPNQNGSSAYQVRLNVDNNDPAKDGNQKIYFIDGNLWIHNKKTYSFKFYHPEQNGTQVTFVVKGNVYISDNLFLLNKNKDGALFIAMRDTNVQDSGNVYIGDPVFGTVKTMETFLYGENDFIDENLNAAGSQYFSIEGLMSGGNQVAINRDYYVPPTWKWQKQKGKWVKVWVPGYWTHSRMDVTLDPRVKDGTLVLPGLPVASGGSSDWTVLYSGPTIPLASSQGSYGGSGCPQCGNQVCTCAY